MENYRQLRPLRRSHRDALVKTASSLSRTCEHPAARVTAADQVSGTGRQHLGYHTVPRPSLHDGTPARGRLVATPGPKLSLALRGGASTSPTNL